MAHKYGDTNIAASHSKYVLLGQIPPRSFVSVRPVCSVRIVSPSRCPSQPEDNYHKQEERTILRNLLPGNNVSARLIRVNLVRQERGEIGDSVELWDSNHPLTPLPLLFKC